MTRPHPVRARTRKPETVLREMSKYLLTWALRDRAPELRWTRELLAELRRSLRDTRGAK
jgi:hypothetical protein